MLPQEHEPALSLPSSASLDTAPNAAVPSVTQSTESPSSSLSKMLVVAGLAGKDFSWIEDRLPGWDSIICFPDDPNGPHHTAQNKGREANIYLTYIIENYDELRDLTAFVHWNRYGWHNDYLGRDLTLALRDLQVNYVLSQKYTNLRCTLEPGCEPEIEILPFKRPPDNRTMVVSFLQAWKDMFPTTTIPAAVGSQCCSQFVVTKDQILARLKTDYERYLHWLMKTSLKDYDSGRIFEYLWHVIFGKEAIHCVQSMGDCWCNLFGWCNAADQPG